MYRLLNNIQGYVQNGYAGNHLMANETDIGQATGCLGLAIGGAIVQFNKTAVFPATLNMVSCPKGTNKARIPVYDKLGTGNVETASTGVEGVTNREVIASNPKDIEVLRNHIDALITDLSVHGNADAFLVNAGQAMGNAVATQFDSTAATYIDDFATIVGADTTGMTMSTLFEAVANLEKNDAPRPYNCVLHPLSVWGKWGIVNEIGMMAGDAATGSQESVGALAAGSAVGDQFRSAGFVSTLGGVNIYTSSQVVGASDYHRGGLFAKTAIGCGFIDYGGGNFIQVESSRNAPYASTEITCNAYFGMLETVDLHGVTIKTETS